NNANTAIVMIQITTTPSATRRIKNRNIDGSLLLDEPVGTRVERVRDSVAEQVEGQHGDQQCSTGEGDEPPGRRVVARPDVDHAARVCGRRWESQSQDR